MLAAVALLSRERGMQLALRVGLASGPLVAGVIGTTKFCYDLRGDTVNTASRMESHGIAGRVHVAESTWTRVQGRFSGESRGVIEVKGKGPMSTWLLVGAARQA